MKIDRVVKEVSLSGKSLHYKLNIIFGLFFLIPVLGFFYFGVRDGVFKDNYLPLIFAAFLLLSLGGLILLRRIFDKVVSISNEVTGTLSSGHGVRQTVQSEDELRTIAQSFAAFGEEFKNTFGQLERKISEVSILKELSDLCYVTFDTEELLYVTLERALKLARADVGSILILERPERDHFVVKATIGLGDIVKVNDKINFTNSIAKYAVINKSVLVIENIENDTRFGRENRSHYGTKSFACIPIKTIRDIVGVLTISRKDDKLPLRLEDVEALAPLVSNAAFTYENLRLLKEREQESNRLSTLENSFKIINSSFKESELTGALLNEMRRIVPFDTAIILARDRNLASQLIVFDLLAPPSLNLTRGMPFVQGETVIGKVMQQEASLIVDDSAVYEGTSKDELFTQCASWSFVPLKTDGSLMGLLVLGAGNHDLFYIARNFIESMADGIALAMVKNRLSQDVVKKNQEMDMLKQIGSFLAVSTFDIGKVLQYTIDMIKVTMNVETGSILLIRNGELEFAVAFNINEEILKRHRIKLGQGIAGYVAARGESLIVNNVASSPHFYPEVDRTTGFSTKTALCVPLVSQGKVIGVIEVLNKRNGVFVVEDEHLLHSIASSVTIALENARLYKEILSMAEHERDIRRMFQKFVPEEIVNKIIHGGETGGRKEIEEFKMLTLLNIDIRGFSALAQNIGPQKTVAILNYFFSIMGGIVFKHHGIVDKYLGDGFLAIFGAPVSSPSDADNAITAALEMKQAMEGINTYYSNNFGFTLGMGISINTGNVIVGNIGFEKKMDYTVIGDQVNTVFRLQYHTKSIPNGILVSETTLRNVRTPLEVHEIDTGGTDPILGSTMVYELLGIKNGVH